MKCGRPISRAYKVLGWGWYYLFTILNDYSRFIIAWRLCAGMSASDVSDTLDNALQFRGFNTVKVKHKPRLLSDNGPSYVFGDLDKHDMKHTWGRPYHPQTQGKIEYWHRSMKNQVLLENYYSPCELKSRIGEFVAYYIL